MNAVPTGVAARSRRRATPAARGFGLAVLAVVLAFFGGIAQAAEGAQPPAPGPGAPAASATATPVGDRRPEGRLVVFNRPVFSFRSVFLGVPPVERAETARKRIDALLERGGDGKVTIESIPQGAVVKIDGALAFVIANDDADPLAGETLESVAHAGAQALEKAIAETKEARDTRLIARAAAWAGGATLVYVLLLWALRVAGRAVTRRILRLAEATVHIKVGGTDLVQRERALHIVGFVLKVGFWAIALLVTYQWIGTVLGLFPYTRPWGEGLTAFLVTTAIGILTAMARAIPDLLVVVVIIGIARAVNGLLDRFFDGVQTRRLHVGWIDADSARPTRRLATIGVWIFALVMAYPYIPGSDSEAFKGLSVLIGLMISIGGSGIVGQAASGMILMYTRTYRPGEYVRIADQEGTIVEMGTFTTRLRTGLGEELSLPNSLILGAVTKNYSRAVIGEGFIVDAAVTIGYDAPWRQIHAMLIEAARRTEGVLATPAPRVFQTALSDFYVEYRLVCQATPTEPRPRAVVQSTLHANIQDVFNEHGVQIMSPHYFGDPAEAKVVPKEKWYAAPATPPK
jgi:small-conductance mechanosensitive channel